MTAPIACGDALDSRAAVASVTIVPDAPEVLEGDSLELRATVLDADGNVLEGREVFWATPDEDVISVSEAGVVTGISVGTAEIAASSEGVDDTALVTVMPRPAGELEVVGSDQREGVVGTALSESLAVRVVDDRGNPAPNVRVAWSVSENGGSVDPAEGTTDEEGIAKTQWTLGTDPGEHAVTAAVSGLDAVQFIAAVSPGPVDNVEVEPAEVRFGAIGTARQLVASAHDRFGNPLPGQSFVWSSTAPEVATVDVASGLTTSRGNGGALVIAQADGVADTASVVVEQLVFSVVVSPPDTVLYVQESARLIATASDSNGVGVPDVGFVWASSNPPVAFVFEDGSVVALTEGTATITATADGISGTCAVEVRFVAASRRREEPDL